MSYVYAGYGITFVALALYALRVIVRGRALRRVLSNTDDADRRPR
jgi:heme exporter protein D